MPNLSLSLILIPYAIFIALFLLFSIFNIFHLIRYSYKSTGFFAVILVYILGTFFLLGASFLTLKDYNWTRPISTEGVIEVFDASDPFLFTAPEIEEPEL